MNFTEKWNNTRALTLNKLSDSLSEEPALCVLGIDKLKKLTNEICIY